MVFNIYKLSDKNKLSIKSPPPAKGELEGVVKL